MLAAVCAAQDRFQRSALFVMQRDGSQVRKVLDIDEFKWLGSPRWSHDGKRLAFEAYGSRPSRCLIVDVTGKNLRDLGLGGMPDWSPDDKQIAFQSYEGGDLKWGTWVQNADGQGRVWLADGFGPRWSPDASRLVYSDWRSLRLRDLAAGGEVVATTEAYEELYNGFDWSPDGKHLAFVAKRSGKRELIIVSTEGDSQGIRSRLTAELSGGVSWSPDGRTLAISIHDEDMRTRKIYTVDVDGESPAHLVGGQQGDNHQPAWSPDGTQLAFISTRRDAAPPNRQAGRRPVRR